jgi:glycosyltransferase involved in cell wall biosynthesis
MVMKTIVIAHNYSEISFAAMSYHFAHFIANKGYRVVFISHKPFFFEQQLIEKNGGKIIVCSWPTKNRPTSIRDFIWFIKVYLKYKPNIVIGHFVGSNITILVSKVLSLGKVKTFEYYHTLTSANLYDLGKITLKQKFLFFRKRLFYRFFCDKIICPSALAKKELEHFFSIKKGIVLLNPMIDRFKNKSNLSDDKIIISFLGRFQACKALDILVKAFNDFKIKSPKSKIVLQIAGSGNQEVTIKELAKNNQSIQFFGQLEYDKIDDYLNKSHYTIIPSKSDNLPTVGLESLMNQTPLLISVATGLADYLEQDKDCYKFESNIESISTLFYKIEANFSNNEQMSFNARATFLNQFTISNYCKDLKQIIE